MHRKQICNGSFSADRQYAYLSFRNQCFTSPKQRLFVAYEAPLSDEQIDDLLEEGKYFLAYDAMVVGEDEFAVQQFEKLNLPEASYYQSQVCYHKSDLLSQF